MKPASLLVLFALLGCRDPEARATGSPPTAPAPPRAPVPATAAELAAEARLCGPGTDPVACRAEVLASIERRQDARAMRMSETLCNANYLLGCRTLGWLHESGRGTPTNPTRARALYDRACEGGETGACKSLGYLLDTGVGGPVDRRRAAVLYQRACDGREYEACNNLANLYVGGDGVGRDPEHAARLYDRVCEATHANRACENARNLHQQAADAAAHD